MADAHTEVREEAGGRVLVTLRGRLDAQSTATCWRELERRLRSLRITTLEVDASGVTLAGGIGAALLRYLAEAGMTPGAHVALQGLSPEAQGILDTFSAEELGAESNHASFGHTEQSANKGGDGSSPPLCQCRVV